MFYTFKPQVETVFLEFESKYQKIDFVCQEMELEF